jgi:hypothetical protein
VQEMKVWPFGVALRGVMSNRLKLRWLKTVVVSVGEKAQSCVRSGAASGATGPAGMPMGVAAARLQAAGQAGRGPEAGTGAMVVRACGATQEQHKSGCGRRSTRE